MFADFLELLGQERNDLEKVADHAIIGQLEDRRFRIGIDRDDRLRGAHASQMLNGAANAAGDIERGRNDLAGLAHLIAMRTIPRIDGGTEAPTAAPRTSAISSSSLKFSAFLSERPPDTTIEASVTSGRALLPLTTSVTRVQPPRSTVAFTISADFEASGFGTPSAFARTVASCGPAPTIRLPPWLCRRRPAGDSDLVSFERERDAVGGEAPFRRAATRGMKSRPVGVWLARITSGMIDFREFRHGFGVSFGGVEFQRGILDEMDFLSAVLTQLFGEFGDAVSEQDRMGLVAGAAEAPSNSNVDFLRRPSRCSAITKTFAIFRPPLLLRGADVRVLWLAWRDRPRFFCQPVSGPGAANLSGESADPLRRPRHQPS